MEIKGPTTSTSDRSEIYCEMVNSLQSNRTKSFCEFIHSQPQVIPYCILGSVESSLAETRRISCLK